MSVSGKKNRTDRKLYVKESIQGGKGFTKIQFAHKATAGDTIVDVNNLNPPTIEMPTFTNPSASRIIEARMFQFKNNVTIESSLAGVLIQDLSYRVESNTTIQLLYDAAEGEIFKVILDASPVSGIQVVDARTPSAEGELAVGQTNFPIGFSTSTQRNELMLYRNGVEQRRNPGNSSTPGPDGNYYVLPGTDPAYGNVVVFNEATIVDDDYIRAVGIGGTVESPTNSTWDEIEKLQGQLDKVVETTAELAGVPETNFQATPNNVDLKQFGDRVLALENKRFAEKALQFDVNSTGVMSDLTFNNLEINTWYQVEGQAYIVLDDGGASGPSTTIVAYNGATVVGEKSPSINETTDIVADAIYVQWAFKFKASDTSLTFDVTALNGSNTIRGNGSTAETYMQLTERKDLIETTDFD